MLATGKFLADCALYGQVKCLRSDNGTEFMNNDFQTLLRKRGIKHETSCPNSPHKNGTAERHSRTLFEMVRCLLLERSVPKNSPAYLVYHPEAGKIMKHRLVKFIKNCSAEQGTQTEIASEVLGSSTKVESEISLSDLQKQDERNSHSEGTGDSIVGEKDV